MADFDRNSTVKELDRIANLYDSKNELEYELYRIAQNEKDEIDEKASTITEFHSQDLFLNSNQKEKESQFFVT